MWVLYPHVTSQAESVYMAKKVWTVKQWQMVYTVNIQGVIQTRGKNSQNMNLRVVINILLQLEDKQVIKRKWITNYFHNPLRQKCHFPWF